MLEITIVTLAQAREYSESELKMDKTLGKDLANFFKAGVERNYLPGEIIMRGEIPTSVFFITAGFVKVYSISDEGDKYTHIIYRSGEIFPLIWALNDVRRKVFYEAISDVKVRTISKEMFLESINSDLDFSRKILFQLSEQFMIYADRLDNLESKDAHERIVHRLLFLAGRFGVMEDTKVIINAPLTHELIAESINLSRETVSREIERLEAKNLINRINKHIVINDVVKLAGESGESISLDLWGLSGNSNNN